MRDRTMTDARNLTKREGNYKIQRAVGKIENLPNNNIKIIKAVKKLNKPKALQHLLVKGKTGLKANPRKQVKVIATSDKTSSKLLN